jgi:DNA (cytosine-5)-methyltransferase 1
VTLTFTDIFCGAGGSSIGLAAAGFELRLAANHWRRAIETHSANFTDAEHLCADVNNYDMRRLPKTDVLWASPICTEMSPAGGRRRTRGQLDLLRYGSIDDAAFERTRATFHDVIRATEVHRYTAVLVENVVEVAWDWELFDWWVDGMRKLGYEVQFVSVSSAHIGGDGNPYAPQWRDRLYIVFTRTGLPLPDVTPRPLALCHECGEDVRAVQSWKRTDRRPIGKYRQQYVYRCANRSCKHTIVEPYVLPASTAIDWTNVGTRIGDRTRPLAESTMRRIRAGLAMFAEPAIVRACGADDPGSAYLRAWPASGDALATRLTSNSDGLACPPLMVNANHDDLRTYPAGHSPLPTRTTKIGDGLLVPSGGSWNNTAYATNGPMRTRTASESEALLAPPFITMLRANNRPISTDEPLATITTGRNHGLTVPPGAFVVKNYTPRGDDGQMCKYATTEPLGALTLRPSHALVIPYRRTNRPTTTAEPLHALSTRESAALLHTAIEPEDCYYRMLQPREHLRAQRFPDEYVVTGNKGEQTMQAGAAVSANVAQWLGRRLLDVMEDAA